VLRNICLLQALSFGSMLSHFVLLKSFILNSSILSAQNIEGGALGADDGQVPHVALQV